MALEVRKYVQDFYISLLSTMPKVPSTRIMKAFFNILITEKHFRGISNSDIL
jgi:hypothetical protein